MLVLRLNARKCRAFPLTGRGTPPIIHLAGVLPSNGAVDRAKDARLCWLDCNLPRLVMPMNKCRTHGEEAKEGSNEGSAFEYIERCEARHSAGRSKNCFAGLHVR